MGKLISYWWIFPQTFFSFRYSNIACELLTCDVGVINDKLGNEEPLLESLYAFLEQPSPLNPLLASFFSKTIGNLIARKTEQVKHSYCNNRAGFNSRGLHLCVFGIELRQDLKDNPHIEINLYLGWLLFFSSVEMGAL